MLTNTTIVIVLSLIHTHIHAQLCQPTDVKSTERKLFVMVLTDPISFRSVPLVVMVTGDRISFPLLKSHQGS